MATSNAFTVSDKISKNNALYRKILLLTKGAEVLSTIDSMTAKGCKRVRRILSNGIVWEVVMIGGNVISIQHEIE